MSVPIVELKGINKAFSGNRVLIDVDFKVDPGETVCLVGENGSGKSTLIKIISGVYTFDAGELLLNGKSYTKITPSQAIDEGIQVIYQDYSIFPNLTVAENIAMSDQVHRKKKIVNWKNYKTYAKEALDKIGVDLDLDKEVGRLPVANKQIVAIARAIQQKAKLLIMDEPTTALTQKEIERLYAIIDNLKKEGVSVIFISHKLDEVFVVSDRISVLRSGNMVIDEGIDTFPKDKLVYYMTGEEITEKNFAYEKQSDEPIFEARDITHPKHIYQDISFKLYPGEILAITGQLGSGRTELAKSLFGFDPPISGETLIDGEVVHIKNQRQAIDHKIAYLPEDRLTEGLMLNRSLGDNFSTVIINDMVNKFGFVDEEKLEIASDKWVDELNMSKKPYTTLARNYSGGNQQRIVVGKWLAANPRIFIMNCPTVGVDVKSKSEIHEIMKRLAGEGMAIIMFSDDIGEIFATSNRVLIMNGGRIIHESNTSDITYDEMNDKIIASI